MRHSTYHKGQLVKWHYVLLLIILTSFVREGDGLRIAQCVSNMAELDMESSNNEFTCDGFDRTDTIRWDYTEPRNTGSITCPPSGSCSENALINATRVASSSSTVTPRADIKQTRTVYGAMTLTCSTVNPDEGTVLRNVSCQIDVVHRAEVTSCNAQFNTAVGTDWTASGSCVISKAFSQRGRYSCLWTETTSGTSTEIQSSRNFTGSFDEEGVTYRSLTCDFRKSLPRVTGSYNYTAVISPGSVQPGVNFKGSSAIVLPTAHTDCPTDYVMEGNNVACTCSSTDGNPAGSAVWRVPSGSSRLMINDVRRDKHGDSYICEVKWGSDVVSNASFRLQVAYGPDTVTITGPPQPFDTDGTKDMTFTCTAGNARPGVTYTWRPLSGGMVVKDNQITLTNVNRTHDGDKIECTAFNKNFSAALRASLYVTLDLHYPPTQAPIIRNSSSTSFVYQGDPLTLTCTVSDGKPVNATTLTFNCPDRQDRNDIQSTTEVNSSVTFDSVVAGDNGDVCTCRGRWKNYTDWYTQQTQATVVVYYAPPKPDITTGHQPYPFLAGESATLYCNYTAGADSGNPTATLTLDGQAGGTGQGQVSVTLGVLSSTDNGRRMVCEASNQFTEYNNSRVTNVILLQVYYPPVISVTSLPSDTCSLSTSSSSVTCAVMEGQRVKVNCTAHSNPSIAAIAWQPVGDNVLDLQADRGTDIDHTCDVTTVDEDGNGNRLPLRNSARLSVLVKYKAEVSGIAVNGDLINRTVVNETDTISFNCTARGRPTAGIVLKKNYKVIGQRDVGDVTRDDVAVLVHTTQQAHCEDAGLYTCSANNKIGDADEYDVKVFVNCRPRCNSTCSAVPREIYYNKNKAVAEKFRLVAFPVPEDNRFTFRVNGSDTNITDNIKLNVMCTAADTAYDVTCTVLVSDVTSKEAEGLYTFSAANAFGQEHFQFKVIVNGTSGDSGGGLGIAAIAGATCGAVVAVGAAAVALFKARQQRKAKKSQPKLTESQRVQQREEPEMTVNELYGTSPGRSTNDDGDEVMIDNIAYVSSADFGNHASRVQGNAYEDVELNSSTNASGGCVSVLGSSRAQASASALKYQTTVNTPNSDDGSNVYATVNKGTKPSLGAQDRPGPASGEKQRSDVKPKPAKKSKPVKPMKKPTGKKIAKEDDKQLLKAGEYGNVGMASLTMSPHSQEGSVYENYAFQKEESRKEKPRDEVSSPTVNEDGLVYTTVAFSDTQLKKAAEPPPEREQTEYAGIDFTRKAPSIKANK